ncbi:glutathione peroxidase [Seohaeicola zhoushanensis]|uniref:Glutathione peroxidase n=2 Tax=Seohaeicola zhoushanensis TaxID=1569283 RepID=A0A8J3H092_9RHOB|nr:glutathione peroxidase [Seohaeicola zhoushanensis]
MMLRHVLALCLVLAGLPALAGVGGTFASIDGGTLSLEAWRGRPVLVVNTASQCGFTPQYAALQKVFDTYSARGLVVLAVPSDDFNQELGSAAEVKAFCELNYDLTLPMTDITHVRGPQAHPFFKAVKAETGFEPGWNFNKILVGPDGAVMGTWGSTTRPDSKAILQEIEPLLK